MEILTHTLGEGAPYGIMRALPEVIETVGRPEYVNSLLGLARQFTRAEHISAFLSTPTGQPRIVLAARVESNDLAQSIAQRYLSRFWGLDPANEIMIDDNDGTHSWAVRLRASDIPNVTYRSECYYSVGLVERFSLVQKRAGRTLRMNFYLGRKESFGEGVIKNLMESAPLLMASLWRHHDATTSVEGSSMACTFRQRLQKVAPTLSSRELDVCALVATGVTSEGISLELGVGVNTVLTYRKRAYSRLHISSQNELMRMLM